jgi:hypothetical protein
MSIDHQRRVKTGPQGPLAENSPQGRPPTGLVAVSVFGLGLHSLTISDVYLSDL